MVLGTHTLIRGRDTVLGTHTLLGRDLTGPPAPLP